MASLPPVGLSAGWSLLIGDGQRSSHEVWIAGVSEIFLWSGQSPGEAHRKGSGIRVIRLCVPVLQASLGSPFCHTIFTHTDPATYTVSRCRSCKLKIEANAVMRVATP